MVNKSIKEFDYEATIGCHELKFAISRILMIWATPAESVSNHRVHMKW